MADVISIDQADSPNEKTPTGWHKFWSKEKTASDKRLKQFNRQGNAVVSRYLDERNAQDTLWDGHTDVPSRLNLFWKNISTQEAMLYGNTPMVDVSREYHDPDDDVARLASTLLQRILQSDVEA